MKGLIIDGFNIGLDLGAGQTTLEGNWVGLDMTLTLNLGNTTAGVDIPAGSSGSTIGGTAAFDGNVLSENIGPGITVAGDDNSLWGNSIGTDPAGFLAFGNAVGIDLSGAGNSIGGSASGEGNLISGNEGDGIDILGLTATANTIQGNVIGLDDSQSDTIGNVGEGIYISNQASGNLIGGTATGSGNMINNDTGVGVDLEDGASSNIIEGNTITTVVNYEDDDDEGSGPAILVDGASDNTIGGIAAGAGNQIKSESDGVDIYSATGVAVRGNSITTNDGIDIDLDSSTNANNLENSPSVTSAKLVGTGPPSWTIVVDGTLDSTPLTTFSIDLYTSYLSYETGQVYLTTVEVTTDSSGNANWTTNVSPEALVGYWLSATATDPGNNTSEFSDSFLLDVDGDGIPDFEEAQAPNNGDGNDDGIPDRFQTNVTSISDIFTLAAPAGTQFENVTTVYPAPSGIPNQAGVNPYGMISFELAGLTPGQAVTVQILVASDITFNAYYIYGPTPDDPTPHWDTFAYNGTTGAQVSGQTITLHLVDGQRGDDDLAANGVIQELGVPVEGPQTFMVTNTSDSGPGSLRQAILDSNAGPAINNIDFDIGSGPQTIAPLTFLPDITNPVIIDATTQPGFAGTPLITLDGLDPDLIVSSPPSGYQYWAGLTIMAGDTTVRGLNIGGFDDLTLTDPATNTVYGFTGVGIILEDNGEDVIEADVIGGAISNDWGIEINSSNNQIGGPGPLDGNVITGNESIGINMAETLGDNLIEGNVISGNGGDAMLLGNDADDNVIERNLIGVSADGTTPSGNSTAGIEVIGASGNTIGGTAVGAGNVIAYNGGSSPASPGFGYGPAGAGVALIGEGDNDNSILGNSIFDNAGLGIDEGDDTLASSFGGSNAVLAGDAGYYVGGTSNFPILSSATLVGGNTVIQGRYNGQPNATYRIEFFSNTSFGPTSFGQGQTYLGFTDVTTDATGNASYTATLPTVNPSQGFVTATATPPDGNTSQFSARLAIGEVLGSVYVVNTTDDTDDGVANPSHMTLRDAILAANEHPGLNTIEFDIGSGVQTIVLNSDLPAIINTVIIDATTQPGYSGTPLIVLQGTYNPLEGNNADGQVVYGLRLLAGGSTVRGLVFHNFTQAIVDFNSGSGGDLIQGCFIGTNATATGGGNSAGDIALGSSNNTIGGTTPGAERDLQRFRLRTLPFWLGQRGRGQPDRNRCHGDEGSGERRRHRHHRRCEHDRWDCLWRPQHHLREQR